MSEDKYYTPSIEEFRPSFEYELFLGEYGGDGALVKGAENKWHKKTWEPFYEMKTLLAEIKEGKYRVKFLDKKDIESFGFESTGKSIDIWFKKEGSFQIGNWTSYQINLHYGLHDRRCCIDAIDCGEERPIFQGTVRNKSELEIILKQVGAI